MSTTKTPKLGFNLSLRNRKNKITQWFQKHGISFFMKAILAVVIPVWGIFLTLRGNKISEASLALAQNDKDQKLQIEKLTDIAKNQSTEIKNQGTEIDKLTAILEGINTQNSYVYKELGIITEDQVDNKKEKVNRLHTDTLRLIKLYHEMTYLNSDKGTMTYWPVKKRMEYIKKLTRLLEAELDNTVLKADPKLSFLFRTLYRESTQDVRLSKDVDPDNPKLSITDSTGALNIETRVFQTRINQMYELLVYLYNSMNPDERLHP